MTADRWLIVGLGNPQNEYGGTRHNVGADCVRVLADRLAIALRPHKARADIGDGWDAPGGTPISLVVPHGYMNNSGGPVQAAMAFYKVGLDRVIVCHDELDLENGVLRLKRGGGNAGHNGLSDIVGRAGGPDFYRVRIGIGRPPGRQNPADYVLKRFSTAQREQIDVTIAKAADAVLDLIQLGLEGAQNRHH